MIIQENVPLAPFTTFRIGGSARFFAQAQSISDIQEALEFASGKNPSGQVLKIFVLGGGSNILISDAGFDGLVIKNEVKGIFEEKVEGEADGQTRERIIASAGESWDTLVKYTVEIKNLYGLENLSAIPGTVGASPVQNIGAYGIEVKDLIEWVEVYNPTTKEIEKLSNADCRFGYRDSIFKHERKNNVILRVAFLLTQNGKLSIDYKDLKRYFAEQAIVPLLHTVREAIISIRKNKLPDLSKLGTAGSFFRNVVVSQAEYQNLLKKFPLVPAFSVNASYDPKDGSVKVPVGWVLDKICGFKGVRRGDVGVYQNQALVLVNFGQGTALEVKKLADEMTACVKAKTGLNITPEVEMI